jgi:hypothetical protein
MTSADLTPHVAGSNGSTLSCIRTLLVDPRGLDALIATGDERLAIQHGTLALTGAALFGAAVGLSQGGLHVLRTALLMPAILLLAAAACVPAVQRLLRLQTSLMGWRLVALRVAAVMTTAAVVLTCTVPLVLLALAWDWPARYLAHLASSCALLSFGIGARHLLPPLPDAAPELRIVLWAGGLAILALAVVQAAWIVAPL